MLPEFVEFTWLGLSETADLRMQTFLDQNNHHSRSVGMIKYTLRTSRNIYLFFIYSQVRNPRVSIF